MNWENETGSFALGDFAVENGGVIREAPRTGRQRMLPARSTARETGAISDKTAADVGGAARLHRAGERQRKSPLAGGIGIDQRFRAHDRANHPA